ncbi:MAG: deoxyribonuclease IV [Candidatus Rokubacteria bacterium]|nr:deoxyribonuclease IV [Candidatus Rokubacteria bacterium]
MSIAGGLHRALERGRAVGCSVVQIFLKNQMQWKARPLTEADVRLWKAARRATGIRTAFAHASYLVNLGTPVDAEWRHAIAAFHDELERAEALGLPFVVIHPGSHKGAGLEAGLARVAAALDELTRRTAGYRVRIVLENTAGAGDTMGRTFGELAALLEGARAAERLGVCLDTCHLFAAGYDIRRRAGYERVMAECERALGVSTIRAFHLNDARAGLGSGLDRHTHIGQGQLGLAPFRFLLNDPRWGRVPKALETPKEPEPAADIANLRTLRRLIARR